MLKFIAMIRGLSTLHTAPKQSILLSFFATNEDSQQEVQRLVQLKHRPRLQQKRQPSECFTDLTDSLNSVFCFDSERQQQHQLKLQPPHQPQHQLCT